MAEPVAFPQAGADHASDDTQKRTELTNIVAAASQKYALKLYSDAADLYSKATALQADLNGEMAPQNADLLYSYGRCLYHVAVSKSDVLGAKVAGDGSAGDGQPGGKRRKRNGSGAGHISTKKEPEASKDAEVAEKVVEKAVESKDGMKVSEEEEKVKEGSKPFFQIRGDDAEWGDDEDEEQQDDEEPDEEEDDDFATAYEILDVARVLLSRQTEKLIDNGEGERKVNDDVKHVRERLADTHDLQAEISLENERFTDAVADSRASLELKQELFPNESSLVAEAHFKLSLALEFASVTTPKDAEGEPEHGSEAQVDEALRKEAASHMEKAIDSSKLRVELESKKLDGLSSDDATKQRRDIAEVKDIISDMETRVRLTTLFIDICC